jgi:UDP-N-acetylmuramate dehydrogenase
LAIALLSSFAETCGLSLPSLVADLTTLFGDKIRRNEPLSAHTTFRLGGPAEVWLTASSVNELTQAVNLARQYQVPVFILGGGANLLIGEGGLRGLVVENRSNGLTWPAAGESPGRIIADSGVSLINLVRRSAQHGLSGLEWAVGIPGTLGGAVVNNAGAYGSDIAHSLTRAELLAATGERLWLPVNWFEYGYRASKLKYKLAGSLDWVVLRAELGLTPTPELDITARMKGFNARRKAAQPPGATTGSIFKNPPGDYAGRLIEAAGLKGYRLGQAQISPVHANFFVNLGGATAADMLKLINTAHEAVKDKFGIELDLEIEVIGEF